jgi:hypothetical protein
MHETCISPDGKYVCVPVSGGNPVNLKFHPSGVKDHSTYIYHAQKIDSNPACIIEQGPHPTHVAFDPTLPLIYSCNESNQLQVFDFTGKKLREYVLGSSAGSTRQILAHPDGGKLLLLTDQKLLWVELPQELRSQK